MAAFFFEDWHPKTVQDTQFLAVVGTSHCHRCMQVHCNCLLGLITSDNMGDLIRTSPSHDFNEAKVRATKPLKVALPLFVPAYISNDNYDENIAYGICSYLSTFVEVTEIMFQVVTRFACAPSGNCRPLIRSCPKLRHARKLCLISDLGHMVVGISCEESDFWARETYWEGCRMSELLHFFGYADAWKCYSNPSQIATALLTRMSGEYKEEAVAVVEESFEWDSLYTLPDIECSINNPYLYLEGEKPQASNNIPLLSPATEVATFEDYYERVAAAVACPAVPHDLLPVIASTVHEKVEGPGNSNDSRLGFLIQAEESLNCFCETQVCVSPHENLVFYLSVRGPPMSMHFRQGTSFLFPRVNHIPTRGSWQLYQIRLHIRDREDVTVYVGEFFHTISVVPVKSRTYSFLDAWSYVNLVPIWSSGGNSSTGYNVTANLGEYNCYRVPSFSRTLLDTPLPLVTSSMKLAPVDQCSHDMDFGSLGYFDSGGHRYLCSIQDSVHHAASLLGVIKYKPPDYSQDLIFARFPYETACGSCSSPCSYPLFPFSCPSPCVICGESFQDEFVHYDSFGDRCCVTRTTLDEYALFEAVVSYPSKIDKDSAIIKKKITSTGLWPLSVRKEAGEFFHVPRLVVRDSSSGLYSLDPNLPPISKSAYRECCIANHFRRRDQLL